MKTKSLFLGLVVVCLFFMAGLFTGCDLPAQAHKINNEADFIKYYQEGFPFSDYLSSSRDGVLTYSVVPYELTSDITITKSLKNESSVKFESAINAGGSAEYAMGQCGVYNKRVKIDGKNHTIKNLNFSGFCAGLFGKLSDSQIIITNITFDNLTINSTGPAGGLIGDIFKVNKNDECRIYFENVHIINSTITTEGNNPIGGFVGSLDHVTGTIKNCSIKNSTINGVDSEACGGFIGSEVGNIKGDLLTVQDCESKHNTISAKKNVGGIYGQFFQTYGDYQSEKLITFKNLKNSSGVEATSGCAGGIIGNLDHYDYANYVFENCHNVNDGNYSKKIVGTSGSAGGILGSATYNGYAFPDGSQINFNNCTNSMGIEATENVGGISGRINQYFWKVTYTNCKNLQYGDVRGINNVGGISGSIEGNILGAQQFTFTNCENNGFVTGSGEYVGGISGKNLSLTPLYTNCKNTSQSNWLTGKKYVGGISGRYGIFVDCTNAMNIKHNGQVQTTWEYVGGIVGSGESSTFNNCSNSGNIIDHTKSTGVNASYIGGIAGYVSKLELTDCSNSGTIAGNDCVGGLVGKADGQKNLINCSNTGNVYAFGQTLATAQNYADKAVKGKVGLIVGYIYGSASCVFKNITVGGNIYVVNDTDYVGGWCGFMETGDANTVALGITNSTFSYKIYLSQNVTNICKTNFRYGENIFVDKITGFNNPTSLETFTYSEE